MPGTEVPYEESLSAAGPPAHKTTTVQDMPCLFNDVGGPSALEIFPISALLSGDSLAAEPTAGD